MKLYKHSILILLFCFSHLSHADGITCPPDSVLKGASPPHGREQHCELADGTLHGPYMEWFANGQLMTHLNYKNGKEHGSQKSWWPNGQLMMEGISIKGKRYQGFKYWSITGQLRTIDTGTVNEKIKE